MGLLVVNANALSLGPVNTNNEDIISVAISVTDANGNPRDGLTQNNVRYTLVSGGAGGQVKDLVNIASGSGLYALELSAGPQPAGGGPFPSVGNSVCGVAISDGGDAGQTLVSLTGR
jgi:hypothetical protein